MTALPDAVISGIAAQLTEDYPGLTGATLTDVVRSVMAKVDAAVALTSGGDPVGTIRRSDAGDIATRVVDGGVPMWRVSHADGTTTTDMQPTLSWTAIYTPASTT